MATADAQTGTVSALDDSSVNSTIAAAHAKKLPKQAQDKLRALSRTWSKSGHMRNALFNAQQDAHARRAELSLQIDHLRRTIERGDGHIGAAAHKQLADLETERGDCLTEISELASESANLPSHFDPSVLTAFLASAGTRRFKTCVPTVASKRGLDARGMLNEVRAELSDLVEEIERIQSAHLPIDDAIANAVSEIERIAARGAVYFGRCRITEPGVNGRTRVGTVRWPKQFDDKGEESIDAGAMLIWSVKDVLIAKARAELERLDEPEEAMSLAARKPRIAEIEALILGLERKEEVLIGMLGAEGSPVSRRSTMSPLAILGVEFDDRPLPAPKPEAEPEETDADRAAALRRSRLRDRTLVASERKTEGADPDHDFG